jgi:hypothetical protein
VDVLWVKAVIPNRHLRLVLPCLPCSTHVEILGNEPMLHDLLRIAAGQHQGMQNSILTKIEDIASKIPWDEL